MAGTLFTSSVLDGDGRQLVLDDTILDVFFYDASNETWDKEGSGSQSWYLENFTPNDNFDTPSILIDRWKVLDSTDTSESSLTQNGSLNAAIEKSEGIIGLSSEGKWKLSGDFEIRLYFDWSSYYNEYRSIAHSFLKVGVDNENAVRVAFTFDGDSFVFSSEKTVNRDLLFFDWQDNGSLFEVGSSINSQYDYLKIQRVSGDLETYVFNTSTGNEIKVGDTISDAVFSGDLFVELGLENKEYNTYRHSFRKFFIRSGTSIPSTKYFSTVRGEEQSFPDRSIVVVDNQSVSIINEETSKLWMRLLVSEDATKVSACNGSLCLTTSNGLLVFDFPADKIYKYSGGSISVADEPISLRNSTLSYSLYLNNTGSFTSDILTGVDCNTVGGTDYFSVATASGVSFFRPLVSGVVNSLDGPQPVNQIDISDNGYLYWSGYNQTTNIGELSFRSNPHLLLTSGTVSFNRTGFYGTDTSLSVFGSHITTFDVLTVASSDQIAVGTTEGITFLSASPGSLKTESISYGVQGGSNNTISDSDFANPLGLDWRLEYTGFQPDLVISPSTDFFTAGENSIKFRFDNPTGVLVSGTVGGIYQDVDFTNINFVYFDLKLVNTEDLTEDNDNQWDFQIAVGNTVLKSFKDTDGPFEKYTDSVDVSNFSGINRLSFRLHINYDVNSETTEDRIAYIDNLRTQVGNPTYRVLPAGETAVESILLQLDTEGRKIYFSTSGGYGALDLDDNQLDFFTPIANFVSDAAIVSGDFVRAEDAD